MSVALLPGLPVPVKRIEPKSPKHLGVRHQRIIALFLRGMSPDRIAKTLDMTPAAVSLVLRSPTAAAMLESMTELCHRELRSLYPKAVDALRRGLDDPDNEIAVRSAMAFFKLPSMTPADPADNATAEDVIARIMEITSSGPVQIRFADVKSSVLTQGRADEDE